MTKKYKEPLGTIVGLFAMHVPYGKCLSADKVITDLSSISHF